MGDVVSKAFVVAVDATAGIGIRLCVVVSVTVAQLQFPPCVLRPPPTVDVGID